MSSFTVVEETVPSRPALVDVHIQDGANYSIQNFTYSHRPGPGSGNASTLYGPPPSQLPMESQAVLIVLYTVTGLMSISGNTVVILVFSLGKRSRSDLRGFLINLAVSDLIMAVFCLPFTFTMVMLDDWVFSAPMCPIVLYMQTVSVTASVATNMAIGIDRFWVVTFPLKSRITKSRSKVVIALIWMLAGGLSSVQLVIGRASTIPYAPGLYRTSCEEVWWEPAEVWRRGYTFFILTLTYILPLTILALTYGIVGRRLWQRTAPGNADVARDNLQLRSKRKVRQSLFSLQWRHVVCSIACFD